VHPTQLKNWRAIVIEGMTSLFEKQDSTADLKSAYEQQLTELYAEIGKLTTQVRLSQKKVSTLSHDQRVALIERESNELPLTRTAQICWV